MSELVFREALKYVAALPPKGPITLSNEQRLKLYGLFKQATLGQVTGERPSAWNLVQRTKWDAWKACEGMSQADAMRQYIDILVKLIEFGKEDIPDADVILSKLRGDTPVSPTPLRGAGGGGGGPTFATPEVLRPSLQESFEVASVGASPAGPTPAQYVPVDFRCTHTHDGELVYDASDETLGAGVGSPPGEGRGSFNESVERVVDQVARLEEVLQRTSARMAALEAELEAVRAAPPPPAASQWQLVALAVTVPLTAVAVVNLWRRRAAGRRG